MCETKINKIWKYLVKCRKYRKRFENLENLRKFRKFQNISKNGKYLEKKASWRWHHQGSPSTCLLSLGIYKIKVTVSWMMFISYAVSLIFVDHMTEFDQWD